MKIRLLGCGGSFGSPLAWNKNGNIDINNKRNFRTRSSVLISINNTNILIVIIIYWLLTYLKVKIIIDLKFKINMIRIFFL